MGEEVPAIMPAERLLRSHPYLLLLLLLTLACRGTATAQEPYRWNLTAPVKRPSSHSNGKIVLFDVSHGGTQGAADWVIDGAFSDFADALVKDGFTVAEYRGVDLDGDGNILFADDRKPEHLATNEAIITFEAIEHADVLVLAESNRPFRVDEYAALKRFVDSGKGLFFISDHYNADRNYNGWDATEAFNGYNRSDLDLYRMAAPYADMRNPKTANAGWLAKTFGLRFRFNAVDWKSGASDIRKPELVEGLTEGVGPILVAAGGTLAILDERKAKGLVYFASSDGVRRWANSVDEGLYFGAAEEGPLAAISKPSAGKAAFLGDSSPLEDQSSRYRREDNGKSKSTHAGWTSPGNAARLALNIVRWLATPEPYVGFNTAGHPPGVRTPHPMAPAELTDPDSGRPWAAPPLDYDPWSPQTYASGSYGSPWPTNAAPTEAARETVDRASGPIPVSAALSLPNGSQVQVRGRVTAELNAEFGMVLSDPEQPAKILAVQIPARFRAKFNPRHNAAVLGREVLVIGERQPYMSQPGLKGVKEILLLP